MKNLSLSSKQKGIAVDICNGLSSKEIAIRKNIEPTTVNYHTRKLLSVFGVANKVALAACLVANEIVTKSDLKHYIVYVSIGCGMAFQGDEVVRRITASRVQISKPCSSKLRVGDLLVADFIQSLPERRVA